MTLFETISQEYDKVGLVRVPHSLERLTASIGCHLLNMSNLQNKRFYNGGSLSNFRTCVVFMAPSGYSKSQHFSFFLNPKTGILAKSGLQTSVRGTFSPESWMGTVANGECTKGIFSTHKLGIVGADEFMKLGHMMNDMGTSNDEVYLMKALDSDSVTKDLAFGPIEEGDIGMTLWAGMRPTMLGLKSGLARRFSFQIFLPTIGNSVEFRKAARGGLMSTKVAEAAQDKIKQDMIEALTNTNTVSKINFKEVEDWIDTKGFIPHFEETIFKRLAAGFSVANGTFPNVKMSPQLELLLEDEIISRDIIRSNPEWEAVKRIVRETERIKTDNLAKFMEKNYQLHKVQADRLVNDMLRFEDLGKDGDWIVLPKEKLHEGTIGDTGASGTA